MRSGKFLSLSEKLKQSELTSKLALLCTLLSSPYFFIFHYFKLHFAGNMIIFFSGAYLISFALSCLKHLHSAKILLIFNASLLLFFYSLLLGKESGAFLVFFSIVPIPIILFENKKKYLILLCSFMPIIFSYLLEYLDYSFLFQQADINPDYLRIIFKFAMSTSFSFSLFASWMFYNSYKEKELRILRKNQELERANKKIKEKTKKETELKTIHQLQLEFLPKISKTIPGFERYQFDVLFTPSSREITGDFYDFYKVGKKIRGFVGDVQGKGARAGFIAVNYLAMLKQFRGQNIPLYSLMETLNVEACNLHINKNFCAGFLWELDLEKNKLTYVHAGLEHCYIFRQGKVIPLQVGGFQLGIDPNDSYEQERLSLKTGDMIIISSDGITDLKNESNERFSEKRLLHFFLSLPNDIPMTEIKQRLTYEILAFRGHTEQNDDITLFFLRVLP